jgi:hypothetical protein
MKYYIIHYTKNTDRRALLEPQLHGDVEWIEKYDREDPFVAQVKKMTKSPLTLREISISLKHFEALNRMVKENIQEAIILEDDVVFYPEFALAKPFHECGFLRLGLGVGIVDLPEAQHPPRDDKYVWICDNPGGCEAQWVSLKFAKLAVKTMNFDYPIDLYHYAFIGSIGEKLRYMNLCYQSSLLKPETQEKGSNWQGDYQEYCKNFSKFKSWNWKQLTKKNISK